MSRQTDLDRLAQLHDDDLRAVVATVEQALMLGDGWLQRTADGSLHARQTSGVILTERTA